MTAALLAIGRLSNCTEAVIKVSAVVLMEGGYEERQGEERKESGMEGEVDIGQDDNTYQQAS